MLLTIIVSLSLMLLITVLETRHCIHNTHFLHECAQLARILYYTRLEKLAIDKTLVYWSNL